MVLISVTEEEPYSPGYLSREESSVLGRQPHEGSAGKRMGGGGAQEVGVSHKAMAEVQSETVMLNQGWDSGDGDSGRHYLEEFTGTGKDSELPRLGAGETEW